MMVKLTSMTAKWKNKRNLNQSSIFVGVLKELQAILYLDPTAYELIRFLIFTQNLPDEKEARVHHLLSLLFRYWDFKER